MHALGHIEGEGRGRLETAPVEIGAAHRQGRQPLDRALHGRRHGAGIEDVGAEVGTVVDAREHQIRRLLHQPEQGQLDAVGGGAAAGPGRDTGGEEFIGPLRPQRGLQGEAMAGGGALPVGTDHGDGMAAPGRFGRQGLDAVGEDPVVVADQDPEGCHRPSAAGTDGKLDAAAYSRLCSDPCRERHRQPAAAHRPAGAPGGGGRRRHRRRRRRRGPRGPAGGSAGQEGTPLRRARGHGSPARRGAARGGPAGQPAQGGGAAPAGGAARGRAQRRDGRAPGAGAYSM